MIGRRAALLLAAIMAALVFSSGVALAVTKTCEPDIKCYGTTNADTLNGTDGVNYIYGRGGGDTLRGFGETDGLYGQGGGDGLFGGPGPDLMVGGRGNDALSGGEDYDNYFFGPNWGKDSITDSSTGANAIYFRKGLASSVYVGEDLIISMATGPGPEAKNKSGTNSLDWDGSVIDYVEGGNGDDTITGNALANDILGGLGDDNISSGGGDDEVDVTDGSGDDSVDCGEDLIGGADNDTVYFDAGDLIDSNCETQNP